MSASPLALLWRHHKERRSKCSLEPLVGRPGLEFRTWRPGTAIDGEGALLLEVDAPVLSLADRDLPLLVLDSTWRLLPAMRASVTGVPVCRSLPADLATAYPRRSKLEPDPDAGLASVEALYAALRILGRRDDDLLAAYHWRDAFLASCAAAGL
ncbi:MAG: hypothetical protein R3F30_14580 [Planctomycetota bacterium]